MTNVATRLISLILLLQKRPGWKAAELAAELGVSQRTVLRYMDMLDELGIPIYSERGRNGGFCRLRHEVRTFRLERIREPVAEDEHFVRPRGFSVREYMERTMPRPEPAHTVVVQVAVGTAQAMRERHGDWKAQHMGHVQDVVPDKGVFELAEVGADAK